MGRSGTLIPIAAVVAVILGSCATTGTRLTGSWTDPGYSGGTFHKIMIVGVARRETMRRIFETSFSEALRAHGVEGVPSATFAPGTGRVEQEILDRNVKELGCDAVLVTRLIDQRTQRTVYPPAGYAVPVGYHGGYYPYYNGAYAIAYSPGFVVESTTASLETNLYDVRTGKLAWTGLTDTVVGDNPASQAGEFIQLLVLELAKAKLIP